MNMVLTAVICAFWMVAAAFHFYWAFGGKFGFSVAVPQLPNGNPLFKTRIEATLFVAAALVAMVAALLVYSFHVEFLLSRTWQGIGLTILSAVFLARGLSWHRYVGLFKKVRDTDFARNDTWFYSPACVLAGIGVLWLVWLG